MVLRRHNFIILKRKYLIFAICFLLVVASITIYFTAIKPAFSPKPNHVIVIDAGHGGRDGGAIGVSGTTESELNLMYAKQLGALCEEYGMKVVLTRSDMNGLYDENASNKKRSEMEKRRKIINESGAEIMVSLHMNAFPLSSSEGAQVFYAKGDEQGFNLAKSVQTSICSSFKSARDYVTVGDYFVLNSSNIPSILIECGFLSNPNEEALLKSEEYCKNFCYSILAGILSFFTF